WFELLPTHLFALSHGTAEDYATAHELGAQIDPENPLFKPGGTPLAMHSGGGQLIGALDASTMPQSVRPSPSQFGNSMRGVLADSGASSGRDLDLDLGEPDAAEPSVAAAPTPAPATAPA